MFPAVLTECLPEAEDVVELRDCPPGTNGPVVYALGEPITRCWNQASSERRTRSGTPARLPGGGVQGVRYSTSYLPEVLIASALVLLVFVLSSLEGRMDEGTRDAIFHGGLALFVLAWAGSLTYRIWRLQALKRAWRAACEGAGLRPVEPGGGFPEYEGVISGRDVGAAWEGEKDRVWLYVRGRPKPGWTSAPALRGVLETDDDGALGVAIHEDRVRSEEIRRVLHALVDLAK